MISAYSIIYFCTQVRYIYVAFALMGIGIGVTVNY